MLGVVTTQARVNELGNLSEELDAADLPEDIALKADKGYQFAKKVQLLKKKKAQASYY